MIEDVRNYIVREAAGYLKVYYSVSVSDKIVRVDLNSDENVIIRIDCTIVATHKTTYDEYETTEHKINLEVTAIV